MNRTWQSAAVGTAYAAAGRLLRLPFNPRLRAYDMFEIEVDHGVVDEAREFYTQHIAADLDRSNESFRSGPLSFFVRQPEGWGSDIKWWAAEDLATYRYFEDVFRRFRVDEQLRDVVDLERRFRVYFPCFSTRSWSTSSHFHSDFAPSCGLAAYTLLTPLADYSLSDGGHLLYRDVDGYDRVYQYRKGTALVFGALLSHGTQPMAKGNPRAYLSFTFGTEELESRGFHGHLDSSLDRFNMAALGKVWESLMKRFAAARPRRAKVRTPNG